MGLEEAAKQSEMVQELTKYLYRGIDSFKQAGVCFLDVPAMIPGDFEATMHTIRDHVDCDIADVAEFENGNAIIDPRYSRARWYGEALANSIEERYGALRADMLIGVMKPLVPVYLGVIKDGLTYRTVVELGITFASS